MKRSEFGKVICLALLLCFIAGTAYAAEWELIKQDKWDTDFNDVYFINEDVGWAVGSRAVIAHTPDGGKTWEKQDTDIDRAYSLGTVCFPDAENGWVIGTLGKFAPGKERNIVLNTKDGGTTWRKQKEPLRVLQGGNGMLGDIDFVDADRGWIVGGLFGENKGFVISTENGGADWDTQFEVDSAYLWAVDFINPSEGWAVGEYDSDSPNRKAVVFHTEDGGNTWEEQARFPGKGLWDVCFTDSLFGWAVGTTIIHTSDGGATWEIQTDGIEGSHDGIVPMRLNKVHFSSRKLGWMATGCLILYRDVWNRRFGSIHTAPGYLLRTEDGGVTWESVEFGAEELHSQAMISGYSSVYFVNPSLGWAVGDYGRIFNTTDGISWQPQTEISIDLSRVDFVDSENGWAAGSHILHTQDGGQSWSRQGEDIEGLITSMDFVDPENGWIIRRTDPFHDDLLHTTDGGSTFTLQNPPMASLYSTREIYSIRFLNQTDGWIAGRDQILTTADGGETWLDVSPRKQGEKMSMYVYGLDSFSLQEVWAVGTVPGQGTSRSLTLRTKNGGKTWNEGSIPSTTALMDVDFTSSREGWAVQSQVIWYTDDGGDSWDAQYEGTPWFTAICFVSEEEGWVVGDNGTILHTRNAGKDWTPMNSGVECILHDICYDGKSSLYVVGEWGTILRLTDPDIRSGHAVESSGKLTTSLGRLRNEPYQSCLDPIYALHQNYPNPSNPDTWMPFSLSEPQNVVIRIYNSAGQLVRTLDLGQKTKGTYLSKDKAAYWDGRDNSGQILASGIYFCVLETDDGFSDSRKMVLLR